MAIWIGLLMKWIATLSFWYKKYLGLLENNSKTVAIKEFPKLVVQIPLFNEERRCEEVVRSCSQLDWPLNKLEIQVLDDSLDNTPKLVDATIQQIKQETPELNIRHIRRSKREGYKAGALNFGLQNTDAEYVAVFDADFRPYTSFLKEAMSRLLASPNGAFVQAPWGFWNSSENLLTRIQARLLGVHFHFEQKGRFSRGLVFNFNGTAGIWRRKMIDACGGWCANSVTEDLYLSYKAAMLGYDQVYADIEPVPSELPNNLAAFLVQQRRWAKGNAQVLKLLGNDIISHHRLSLTQKLDMIWHLIGYGLAAFLVLWFLGLPLYVEILSQWIEQTSWSSFSRVVALFSSLIFVFSALNLLASKRLCSKINLKNSKMAIWDTFSLLLFAPLMILLIGPSYFIGLFTKSKTEKQLFFARTPKGVKVKQRRVDQISCLLMLGYYLVVTQAAILEGLWPLGLISFASLGISFWLVTNPNLKFLQFAHR